MKIIVNGNKKLSFVCFKIIVVLKMCEHIRKGFFIHTLFQIYIFNTSHSAPDLVPLYILYFTYTEVNMTVADHLVEKSYRYAYYMHY